MSDTNSHPAFDPEEAKILSTLVPEGEDANEPRDGLPTEQQPAPAADPAPAAPAVPAATEAAPAPAPAVEATAPAAATTTETGAATEAAAAPATPPGGDTRAALRAARHAEKNLREENKRLAVEVEALKQGKAPVDTSITDEELATLEVDFPLQAKIVKNQRELERKLAEAKPAPAAPETEFVPMSYEPQLQELIDGNPDLLAWQYDPNAQDKFVRAIEYDVALQRDPDWRGKPIAERFNEAARRTKAAFGTAPAAAPTPTPQAAPAAAPRIDPAAAIDAAPSIGPKGISDFRGGAPGNAPTINYAGMTDEQIMASLPVS